MLIVEDDPAVRRSLQLLLSARGFEVRAYPGGTGLARDPEALRADCLVADLFIPSGDAVELLANLRAAGWKGPAVLISGLLTQEWTSKALRAGYAAVLAKPVADSVLTAHLTSLLPHQAEQPSGERRS